MGLITARIDQVTGIPQEYRSTVLPAPRSVKIELTSRCNYKCGFCAHSLRAKKRGEMDWDSYCSLVRDMRAAGVEELGLFYIGESFMVKWLPNAIRYAKMQGFPYVFLTTNGSLASPDMVRKCLDAGLDSLKFSINNCDEDQFAEVAGVKKGLFHKAITNLKSARTIRDEGAYQCGIYASSIRYDGEQQERMQSVVDEITPYVDEHYWLPLYSMGSLAAEREAELGFRPTAGNQGRLGALRDPLPCWSVFTEGHITHDCKMSACCFDAAGKWTMADLKHVDFMTGWNSEGFQKLRAAHLSKDVSGTACESCVAYSS